VALIARRSDFGLQEALDAAAEAALLGAPSPGSAPALRSKRSVDLERNASSDGGMSDLHHHHHGSSSSQLAGVGETELLLSHRGARASSLTAGGGGGVGGEMGEGGTHSSPLRSRGAAAGSLGSGKGSGGFRGASKPAVAAAVAAMPMGRKVMLLLTSLPW